MEEKRKESQEKKQFVYEGQKCPQCGSSDYAGDSAGGRCHECGYTFGFHGSSEFKK